MRMSSSPIFVSISVANLFLHNLALMGFLSSKIGFHGFRKKFNFASMPHNSASNNKAYHVGQKNLVNLNIKPAKNNSGKLLVHNFTKTAAKLLNFPKKQTPLSKNNSLIGTHEETLTNQFVSSSPEPLYDIAYFKAWLLEVAHTYHKNHYFNAVVDKEFDKRYVKDPIVNENADYLSYFLNTKNLEIYCALISRYNFFKLSHLRIFESLAHHHYGPSLEKESVRQKVMIDLFKSCFESKKFESLGIEETNRLLSYWLVDYVFKLENLPENELRGAIDNFNSVVEAIEKLGFLKNIHPDIYRCVLKLDSSKEFFLKPPVYQNPKFLEFLNLRSSIDKFKNKTFLFNLVYVYKDYCENQLYYSFGTEAYKTVEILHHQAQAQYLNMNVIIAAASIKKVHKI